MNPQDLDKLIDRAAREMVSGEPSRSFTYDVMSQVRGHVEPARRRFVFAIGIVSVAAVGAVILIVMLNRASVPVTGPQAQRPEMPEARTVEQVTPVTTPARAAPRPESRQVVRLPVQPDAEASIALAPVMTSLEPLGTEPIVLSALDVPPLESPAMTIEDIEIEDITIEPLVASND